MVAGVFWIGWINGIFLDQWDIYQATEKPDNLFKASFTSIVQKAPDEVLKIPYRYICTISVIWAILKIL